MHSSHPVFSQQFDLLQICVGLLLGDEPQAFGVYIDEAVLEVGHERRNPKELIDNTDVLKNGSLHGELVHGLPDHLQYFVLDSISGQGQQLLDEFIGVEGFQVVEVTLHMVEQLGLHRLLTKHSNINPLLPIDSTA